MSIPETGSPATRGVQESSKPRPSKNVTIIDSYFQLRYHLPHVANRSSSNTHQSPCIPSSSQTAPSVAAADSIRRTNAVCTFPATTMIAASRRWFRRNRTAVAITAGAIGATYLVGQYVLGKISESRERMIQDRIAKEKYVPIDPQCGKQTLLT